MFRNVHIAERLSRNVATVEARTFPFHLHCYYTSSGVVVIRPDQPGLPGRGRDSHWALV